MKIQRFNSIGFILLMLFFFGSACSTPESQTGNTPLPVPTDIPKPLQTAEPTEFKLVDTCAASTAEEYFDNRDEEGFGSEIAGLLLAAQREKEDLCGPDKANILPKLTITNCTDRFELSLDYELFGADEIFDLEGNLLFGLAGSDTNSFCGNTAFETKFGKKPTGYDQCETLKPNICDQNYDELLALFTENRFGELMEAVQVEESNNWRDVGELDAQTKACLAPTAEDYYQERQMEFGGIGGIFSEGSLGQVLENLPYGDCSDPNQEFPFNTVTQCAGEIAFANSGGFTLSDEYFSIETGDLVYAKTSTDFNAFCKNASFDVSFGEKPAQACKTTKVSYCGVNQEEIIGLYDSGDFDQIVPAILAAQEE